MVMSTELRKGMNIKSLKDITVHDRNTQNTYNIPSGSGGVIDYIGHSNKQKMIVMCFSEGSAVYYGEDMTGFNDNIEVLSGE
jgi:hypothetical protein